MRESFPPSQPRRPSGRLPPGPPSHSQAGAHNHIFPSALSSTPSPLVSTKSSKPKRIEVGEDLIEDTRSGITGLEATSTVSFASSHPIPLFHTVPAHLAAMRLSSALSHASASIQPAALPAPTASSTCNNSPSCATGSHLPSALLASVVSSGNTCLTTSTLLSAPVSLGALSTPAHPSVPVSPGALGAPALPSEVSHGTACMPPSALPSAPVSLGAFGAPALPTSVSPCTSGAS